MLHLEIVLEVSGQLSQLLLQRLYLLIFVAHLLLQAMQLLLQAMQSIGFRTNLRTAVQKDAGLLKVKVTDSMKSIVKRLCPVRGVVRRMPVSIFGQLLVVYPGFRYVYTADLQLLAKPYSPPVLKHEQH